MENSFILLNSIVAIGFAGTIFSLFKILKEQKEIKSTIAISNIELNEIKHQLEKIKDIQNGQLSISDAGYKRIETIILNEAKEIKGIENNHTSITEAGFKRIEAAIIKELEI